jgi:hypothetical protein
MKRKIFIAFLFSVTLIYSNEHYLRGKFSYPLISGLSNDSIKFISEWGFEYNIEIINRMYGIIGFDDVYWLSNKQSERGYSTAGGREPPNSTEYLSFFAGISYDLLKYQHFNLNTGIGGGLLFHFYRCNGENYYPHYFISLSPRFPVNNWLCLGINYSLSSGADRNIFLESIHSFGIESSLNLTRPINKIAQKCKVPEECKKIKHTGYNIAGYSLLITGLACTGASIPFFVGAFNATPRNTIGYAIGMTFGSIVLGSGTIFEFGSIPLFALHKKKVCAK